MESTEKHQELPHHHQKRPPEYGAAHAQIPVSNVASNKRGQVNQPGIVSVNGGRKLFIEHQRIDKVQGENSTHSVVTEAFRHSGNKNKVQPFGVRGVCSRHNVLFFETSKL